MRKINFSLSITVFFTFSVFSLFLPIYTYSSQTPQSVYTIQTGSFTDLASAEKEFDSITNLLDEKELDYLRIEKIEKFYSVRLGKFENRAAVAELLKSIKSKLPTAVIMDVYFIEERIAKLYKSPSSVSKRETGIKTAPSQMKQEIKLPVTEKADKKPLADKKAKSLEEQIGVISNLVKKEDYDKALKLVKAEIKLKPGARGKICLGCHEDLRKILKARYVHPLLKTGECSRCHNPHTSSHKNLLTSDTNKLCSNCHKGLIPEDAHSFHQLVVEGNCIKCHDPHASNNKFILTKAGNELCFDCHEDIGNSVKTAQFKHEPVEKKKGCLNCHNPHASAKFNFLLKDDVPSLCIECHKSDKPIFARRHMNYPVADSNCSSCHNTHGSNKEGIIFDNVHAPVAEKKCRQCHKDPGSQFPLALKNEGVKLCRECHNDMIEEIFDKNRIHWPLVDKVGCSNCHSPHAAKQENLITGSIKDVCGECHSDTVELQEISKNNPKNKFLCEPVKAGDCISCHSPHSSDNILLTKQPYNSITLCESCHEWLTHSTHPIGKDAIDHRNKNLTVECVSCHKACGTGNKYKMLHFETTYEMCVQCHKEYKRRGIQ